MISNGPITVSKLLIPYLTLSRVEEDAVLFPPVLITVLLARRAGERQHDGSSPWGRDAPLVLAAVWLVDLSTTVIDPSNLERRSPFLLHSWSRSEKLV
jgi:hypothetical protein